MDKVIVEWVTPPYFTRNDPFCPWCGNYQSDDHREDCARVLAVTALQAANAEVERLREILEALIHGLGLRRNESELISDYGMLGLDIIQRARRALGEEA